MFAALPFVRQAGRYTPGCPFQRKKAGAFESSPSVFTSAVEGLDQAMATLTARELWRDALRGVSYACRLLTNG